MTINVAIDRGLVSAEPTNDLTLPFAFVRRDEPEYVKPSDIPVEDDNCTLNFILNKL